MAEIGLQGREGFDGWVIKEQGITQNVRWCGNMLYERIRELCSFTDP